MRVFSREQANQETIDVKIRRAIIMSGLNKPEATGNADYRAKHNYKSKTECETKIRDKVKKQQEQQMARRTRAKNV